MVFPIYRGNERFVGKEKSLQGKIKVLVVDDSAFATATISKKLGSDADLLVIGSAGNGIEAIEKIKAMKPDVVTLDVAMPQMDGITALTHIMSECPVPVIMLSALTTENAETTIRALEIGAVDFFLKPSVLSPAGDGTQTGSLVEKIKIAAKVGMFSQKFLSRREAFVDKNIADTKPGKSSFANVVVIGSSTGGPRALAQVVPLLPRDINAAILLVQHMPPVFTKSLAERLNQSSQIRVREAQQGDKLEAGLALLAPGGYHMLVNRDNTIILNQEPPVLGVRPAVDVTMRSAAEKYGSAVIGVILTGMNCDGTQGSFHIKQAGGRILAQDKETSAVYGMPMSVYKAGYVNKVLPIDGIAGELVRLCEDKVEEAAAAE